MVDEQAVLLVLVRVREVEADHLDVAALGGELRVGGDAHDVAAERHDDVLEARVAAQAGAVRRRVHGAVGPVLHGHDGEVRAVLDDDLDRLVERRGAHVVEHDDGLGVPLGAHEDVARRRRAAVALDPHGRDVGRHGLLGHGDDGRLLERVPRGDGGAVARLAGRAEALVVAADDRDLDLGRLDDRDAHVAAARLADDLLVEQRREARDGREAPLLLAPGGHGDVGEVERREPLGARALRHDAVGVRPVGLRARVVGRQAGLFGNGGGGHISRRTLPSAAR